ncbi:MAG: hypothetical protein A2087_08730 [Spirochaetes bacterium GWD1_61_31]|nr:MAG: hypothetical protein A2Y37_13105 [Spirochaetes bacterium GWB1_60_80]OHD32795.1 MAG: hypothetical protein A2004_11080 [Spirochaetes bacterium GWC1_61_12]OHD35368.1 MAG: hypothetical protein A2087_08730 [Spirochaetes bacterium GWD1_61_31]OHD42491.1 MAG: hypothetical protein A2Y35_07900 [Spirochaetes bacterium GWE1_60_18]OHD58219.1 MAG: hypothetical protein A2Y32_04820 [Spirochaetes bacterium GWF1_60_12]
MLGATVDQVLEAASRAGVRAVEWSCDGFIERGDTALAGQIMVKTLKAGLSVASFATLFRVGLHAENEFGRLLETAQMMHAPLIRLWSAPAVSGDYASRKAADQAFIDQARRLGDQAGTLGVTLCFGVARDTVLNSWARAANLFSSIKHPFVKLSWEPAPDIAFDDSMEIFCGLSGQIGMLVARSAAADGTIHSLCEHDDDWSQYLDAFDEQAGSPEMVRYVLLRGIKGGDHANLRADADLLKYYSTQLRRYRGRRVYG